MIPKRITKFIKSLQIKKYRRQHQSFLVEGAKSVIELIHSDFEITTLLCTPVFLKENKNLIKDKKFEVLVLNEEDLSSLGTYKTNNSALAIATMKVEKRLEIAEGELALGLEDVRDPGNLGTIIRIADWYGISKIICSENSAEFYNPKVINATMGSFTRVDMFYTSLTAFIRDLKVSVYGAFLNGKNIHSIPLNKTGGFIIMGNESLGITQEITKLIDHKISIPQYGQAESLNVAIATAVICDNFRRKEEEIGAR